MNHPIFIFCVKYIPQIVDNFQGHCLATLEQLVVINYLLNEQTHSGIRSFIWPLLILVKTLGVASAQRLNGPISQALRLLVPAA